MPNVYLWLLHEYVPPCEHVCTDIEHGEREGGREKERREQEIEAKRRHTQRDRETEKESYTWKLKNSCTFWTIHIEDR